MKGTKVVLTILLIILGYELIFNIVPYLLPKNVSEQKITQINSNLYGNPTSDRAALIETCEDAFNIRLALVSNATVSIDISYHIITRGETAQVFLYELIKAADRGVEVRLLLDGKPSTLTRNDPLFSALNERENVIIAYYSDLNFFKPWTMQSFMHDKIIIADDTWLLTGGRNIGERFFAPDGYKGNTTFDRDVLINKTNDSMYSAVDGAKQYFEDIWSCKDVTKRKKYNQNNSVELDGYSDFVKDFQYKNEKFYTKNIRDYENSLIEVDSIAFIHNPINTSKKEPWIGYQLQKIVENAENYILIQTPYSTANKILLNTLENATAEEKMMVTNSALSSPNFFAFSNYMGNREKFLNTGFDIYEYQSLNSIHAKTLLVDDDISVIGSFNMDDRSLHLSTENMIVIKGQAFQEELKKSIYTIKDDSLMVGPDNQYIQEPEEKAPYAKNILLKLISYITNIIRIFI